MKKGRECENIYFTVLCIGRLRDRLLMVQKNLFGHCDGGKAKPISRAVFLALATDRFIVPMVAVNIIGMASCPRRFLDSTLCVTD